MKQKKKLVKKITNPQKRNRNNAVDGWNEFLKDLKQLEVEHQQRDLEFKSNIDPAKRNAAYNKLIRVVINKYVDLLNDVEKEFSEDEINLIEERIEIPDSIGTYSREIFREITAGFVSMIIRKSKHKNRGNKKAGGYKIEDVNRWLDQLRLFCSQEDKEYNTPVKIEYIIDRLESTIKGNDTLIKRANDLRNIRNFFRKINIKENYFDIEKMYNEGYDNETIILFLKIKIDKNKSLLTFDASNVIR